MSQGDVWRKRSRRTEVDVALSDESGGQGLERGVVCVCWARMKCLLTKIGERYWSCVAGGVMNGWAKLMKVLGRTAG